MKPVFLLLAGLFAAVPLQAQSSKPGTVTLVSFDSIITTQASPIVTPVTGGTRRTYASTAVRFSNREILDTMRASNLLDGTIFGWQLGRLANPSGVGRLYALKSGKAAVLVPSNLLTEPQVTNSASQGLEVTSNTAVPVTNLSRKVYGSITVRGGAGNIAGNQSVASSQLRLGNITSTVLNRTEVLTVVGRGPSVDSVVTGNFQTLRSTAGDLSQLLPGTAVP